MPHNSRSCRWCIAALVLAVSALPTLAEEPHLYVTPLALSGQQAAGFEAGTVYRSFGVPLLNNAGDAAFTAALSGLGVTDLNDIAIWSGPVNTPELIIREGTPLPEWGGDYTFAGPYSWDSSGFNDAGELLFQGRATYPGLGVSDPPTGIWIGGSQSLRLVARPGAPAPGTSTQFWSVQDPVLSANGSIAFHANLVDRAWEEWGVWGGAPDALAHLIHDGDPVPPAGELVTWVRDPAINARGQVILDAVAENGSGIWVAQGRTIEVAVRSGDPVPGTDLIISSVTELVTPKTNRRGQIAFNGGWHDPTVGAGGRALWLKTGNDFELVLGNGREAPGFPTGHTISDNHFWFFSLSASGAVAISTSVRGPVIERSNDEIIYAGPPDDLRVIAWEGDHAPGTPDGVVFAEHIEPGDPASWRFPSFRETPLINGAGQVAFEAWVVGPGIDLSNDLGLWATTPEGTLVLVAREGDWFDIGDGSRRQIKSFSFNYWHHAESGHSPSFTDDGKLAMSVRFADGSSGIFLVHVPEPMLCSVVGLVVAGLKRRRRIPRSTWCTPSPSASSSRTLRSACPRRGARTPAGGRGS